MGDVSPAPRRVLHGQVQARRRGHPLAGLGGAALPEGSVPLVRVERVEVDLSETVETVDPVERSGAVWSAVGVTLISGAGEGREGGG